MAINIGSISNVLGKVRGALSAVNAIRSLGSGKGNLLSLLTGSSGGLGSLIGGLTNTLGLGGLANSAGGLLDVGSNDSGEGSGGVNYGRPSYAFEHVFATLTPFQFPADALGSHPLAPIRNTGGLVFPYNPVISEGISVKYDQIELAHSNESFYSYKGTDNVRITMSDAVWTCDTFSNAVYALSVLHFFRSYSMMDFGRFKTGRPPSPMWFSAYGNYAYNRVPCLLEKADWSFPNDVDYVGVPEFGSPEYNSGILQTNRNATGNYTWMPVKFTVSAISLLVQHAPTYWTNFNLTDYWSGKMLRRDGNFHTIGPSPGGSVMRPSPTPPAPTPSPSPSPGGGFGGGTTDGGGATGSF